MTYNLINTSAISVFLENAIRNGYVTCTVPLTVSKDIMEQTRQHEYTKDMAHLDKFYVSSAEQSFLQLVNDKQINGGKYVAISPCFRDEPTLDESHFNIFLKIELFIHKGTVTDLNEMVDFCKLKFAVNSSIPLDHFEVEYTGINQLDINLRISDSEVIELGSYGIREFKGSHYVYGTCLAEPRYTYAVRKYYKNPLVI